MSFLNQVIADVQTSNLSDESKKLISALLIAQMVDADHTHEFPHLNTINRCVHRWTLENVSTAKQTPTLDLLKHLVACGYTVPDNLRNYLVEQGEKPFTHEQAARVHGMGMFIRLLESI